MNHYEKWSYYTDNNFIEKNSLRIEEEEGDLKLYYYFSTLRWRWCYAIVYKNTILREYEGDCSYDEWNMAIDLIQILKEEKK